jgi:hypothetical protein
MMFVVSCAVLELLMSRGGICKLRPRGGRCGLLGVTGRGARSLSSLETLAGSRNDGAGESDGFNSSGVHAPGLEQASSSSRPAESLGRRS